MQRNSTNPAKITMVAGRLQQAAGLTSVTYPLCRLSPMPLSDPGVPGRVPAPMAPLPPDSAHGSSRRPTPLRPPPLPSPTPAVRFSSSQFSVRCWLATCAPAHAAVLLVAAACRKGEWSCSPVRPHRKNRWMCEAGDV